MAFQKGHKLNLGRKRPDMRERMRGNNNPVKNPKIKEKIKKTLKLYWTPAKKEEQRLKTKGKSWSPETQFKKGQNLGENHPCWKGGHLGFWQKQAKIRDNYTCQICGLRDDEIIEVDHIIPVSVNPSLKFELSNLLTLCPNCHRRKTNRELRQKMYKNNI
jgi:hypothetical protein